MSDIGFDRGQGRGVQPGWTRTTGKKDRGTPANSSRCSCISTTPGAGANARLPPVIRRDPRRGCIGRLAWRLCGGGSVVTVAWLVRRRGRARRTPRGHEAGEPRGGERRGSEDWARGRGERRECEPEGLSRSEEETRGKGQCWGRVGGMNCIITKDAPTSDAWLHGYRQ